MTTPFSRRSSFYIAFTVGKEVPHVSGHAGRRKVGREGGGYLLRRVSKKVSWYHPWVWVWLDCLHGSQGIDAHVDTGEGVGI